MKKSDQFIDQEFQKNISPIFFGSSSQNLKTSRWNQKKECW